jgi:two-component system LytT family response regulator
MKKITAIIIDDERKAILTLKDKLERICPQINLIAETQKPEEGIKLIETLKPQLVFLDIAMPQMSGFDLLQKIETPNFEIIFVTAFDSFAIEAIKHCAIGYLVKPVDNTDLVDVVKKAEVNIEQKLALEKNKTLIENMGVVIFQNKKMIIPSQDGLEFVRISDVVHCEGINGYTQICLSNGSKILSSKNIGYFCDILNENPFYLIHKSHLINIDYIEKYLNEGYIQFSNQQTAPVSRSKRIEFLNFLKNQNG